MSEPPALPDLAALLAAWAEREPDECRRDEERWEGYGRAEYPYVLAIAYDLGGQVHPEQLVCYVEGDRADNANARALILWHVLACARRRGIDVWMHSTPAGYAFTFRPGVTTDAYGLACYPSRSAEGARPEAAALAAYLAILDALPVPASGPAAAGR